MGRSYLLKANGIALTRSQASRVEPGDAIVIPPREPSTHSLAHAIDSSWRFLSGLAASVALIVAVRR